MLLFTAFPSLPTFGQELGGPPSGRIAELQKKLQLDPEDTEALLALALEYSLQKQYAKAVDLYFKVLKIEPRNFHAFNNLGILYKKTGQYADAIHCYEQAQKLQPDSYWVPYNMGLAYESMGRMQEARESYGKALSLNPDFSQALQRLRELSDEPSGSTPLPPPPGAQVLVADAPAGQPKSVAAPPAAEPAAATPAKGEKPEPAARPEKPEKPVKPEKGAPSSPMIRTLRTGPAATLYNEAMDALEKEELTKAVEIYVRCVVMEREFLSEPENGLIQKGLELLNDRPNSMKDGLFYRGFLLSISRSLEKAIPDLQMYIEKNPNGPFVAEAKKIITRHESDLAAAELAKQKQASAAAALEAAKAGAAEPAPGSFTPRVDDVTLKTYSIDQILDEANRLSRDNRTRDAIAVLRSGLEKEPDNIRLLMAAGNAYVDLLLQKNERDAGLMARDLFEKVSRVAPADSKEAGIAASMIRELDSRLK
ncbi:MAG TPA: tetratricopeptide repeat protein [Candidatus Ozemobacteraceae bacterium]|nr:tetratricopeptide repeat protein [Candidatus Ozemobacteraceae bacterium]